MGFQRAIQFWGCFRHLLWGKEANDCEKACVSVLPNKLTTTESDQSHLDITPRRTTLSPKTFCFKSLTLTFPAIPNPTTTIPKGFSVISIQSPPSSSWKSHEKLASSHFPLYKDILHNNISCEPCYFEANFFNIQLCTQDQDEQKENKLYFRKMTKLLYSRSRLCANLWILAGNLCSSCVTSWQGRTCSNSPR